MVVWKSLSRQGLATMLPAELHPALFEWTPIQIAIAVNSSMDFDEAVKLAQEVAPLALVRSPSELKLVLGNMSSHWRSRFEAKGLVSFLPWQVQKVLLPPNLIEERARLQTIPTTETPANLTAQVELAHRLANERAQEATRMLEERSRFMRLVIHMAGYSQRFREKIRSSSWAELQVFALIFVFFLLFARNLVQVGFALLRYFLHALLEWL